MSEETRKQYEEAAKDYANKFWAYFSNDEVIEQSAFHTKNDTKHAFIIGCVHAHSKIGEAEREAWNRALDEVADMVSNAFSGRSGDDLAHAEHEIIEELKKLRR